MVISAPPVTGYILTEPGDIAKLLKFHALCDSCFLNKPITVKESYGIRTYLPI